jgi:hypothetical protein
MNIKSLIIVVLTYLFVLSACADTNTDTKGDIWKLSKEKSKLSREMSSMFREQKIEDKELDELSANALSASVTFAKARKNHPALKEQNKASGEAQSRMIKAMTAKDDAASKAAREAYVEAQKALVAASGNIPEIVELQNKASDANNAVKAKEHELLAATPEGKVLFDKIQALDVKIEALRKQL